MKKRIDLARCCSSCVTVAYFVAAAKGHGHGSAARQGFLQRRVEGRFGSGHRRRARPDSRSARRCDCAFCTLRAGMSATSDFRPGLEGVVAFETEIAEPDKDGGALRYRGIDIEELVGRYPVRERLGPARRRGHQLAAAARRTGSSCRIRAAPFPPTFRPRSRRSARSGGCRRSSTSPTRRRATISRSSRRATLTIVAQAARGKQTPVPEAEVDEGRERRGAVPDPLARRGGPAARSRRSTPTGSRRPSTG